MGSYVYFLEKILLINKFISNLSSLTNTIVEDTGISTI